MNSHEIKAALTAQETMAIDRTGNYSFVIIYLKDNKSLSVAELSTQSNQSISYLINVNFLWCMHYLKWEISVNSENIPYTHCSIAFEG